ncbi:MAG: N(1)-aminopropylagmatine ureohydrolase [Chroococcopsis gigantea SAG 12.99]|jgi:agmatinase|nr:agmatinase [Chlorogloea purpurea SAG 13.99]MDV2999156.1 N(1)-aminopropylagmatine ureohydrolase [Chroococcopsis gigantea SAG 12.99]
MLLSTPPIVEQFLGSESLSGYETAKAVILPIPYEATTTFRKGCENGPSAVLNASQQLEAYDEELERETCIEVGIYTHEEIADTRRQPSLTAEEMLAVTSATVSKFIADNKFVVAIGGEHAITTGVVQAYKDYYQEPFTVVQIDAHGDMRYEYEGSLHNHACVMRRVLEMGLPTLPVGIRAICAEEAALIKEKGIPVQWDRGIYGNPDWIEKAIAAITTDKVFITIDVDGIDPSLIPGVGTPEPGGLTWNDTIRFLRRVFQTHEVIGCDVMELAPIQDSVVSEFTTAKLIYKLIGYKFS